MPTKIVFTVQKGQKSGETFTYDGKESLILGRQDDCSLFFPEATVSRYHCLVDIAPPSVVVRDFGSYNGTYLNGRKIGQRDASVSAEDAWQTRGEEFEMKPGDRLGLGKDCELVLDVKLPQYCADCFCEIDDSAYVNPEKLPICADCNEQRAEEQKIAEAVAKAEKKRAEAKKKAAELAARKKEAANAKAKAAAEKDRREAETKTVELGRREEEQKRRKKELEEKHRAEKARKEAEQKQRHDRRCEVCGESLPGTDAPGICEACQSDPRKVLLLLMKQAKSGVGEAREIAGYRNIKMLGKGGMGQVWLVEEEKTGQQMALKLMLPQAAANPNSREAFLREAYLAGQLDHKNVVRQYKCGQSGDTYFILMELCDGGSADSLIKKSGGKLSVELATNITLQVLDGLIYAHDAVVSVKLPGSKTATANGIVHRDFKPGNIFLTGGGKTLTAKVADFGLAKAFETAGLSGHSRTGQLAGTAVFMPRQQIIEFKYAKSDVDVWATAASFYFMLTGTFSKNFENGKDAFATALSSDAIPIRKRNAAIPRKLAEVIDQALIEKPAIGVKSAAELKKMIEGAL
jgi:serine/threonine-protein kinase